MLAGVYWLHDIFRITSHNLLPDPYFFYMKTLLFPSFLHLQNGFNKPSLLLNPRQFFFAVIIGLLSVATTSVVNSQSQANYAGANFMASSGTFSPLSGATSVPTICLMTLCPVPYRLGLVFFIWVRPILRFGRGPMDICHFIPQEPELQLLTIYPRGRLLKDPFLHHFGTIWMVVDLVPLPPT